MSSETIADVVELRTRQEGENTTLRQQIFRRKMLLTQRKSGINPSDTAARAAIDREMLELSLETSREYVELYQRHWEELKQIERDGAYVSHEDFDVVHDATKFHQRRVADFERELSRDDA